MQREFEMVVQTSAATQSLRYLLKSGDMTCITKGEITKRLEAAVLLQELSFQAVMTSGEVVEDMLENNYEDYDEALRDSLKTHGITFKDYTFAVTYKYDEEAVFKPFFSRQYGADLGFSLPLVDDMKYANMCVCLALIKLSRIYALKLMVTAPYYRCFDNFLFINNPISSYLGSLFHIRTVHS